jgi:beta-glucosidase
LLGEAPVLPLDPASIRTIAVIGRLASALNMGDHGSSDVHPPSFASPLDGIRASFPSSRIVHVESDDIPAARHAAASADVAIVVAGYDAHDEGEFVGPSATLAPELLSLFPPMTDETRSALAAAADVAGEGRSHGGDRAALSLRGVDEDIIRAVAAANPSTVVVLVASGAVLTESWRPQVPALVMMWYAGMEGGHALAQMLTGETNPTGRLPFAFPTSGAHLPSFDRDATAVTYDRFHGQRLLDRLGVAAAFPHGFGLSYTTFDIPRATVEAVGEDQVKLSVQVTNTGRRDGGHVVQVYGRSRTGPYAGELLLVGFAPVFTRAGLTVSVPVTVSLTPLAAWDPERCRRVRPLPSDVELEVGSHAHDPGALALQLVPH